MSFLCQRRAPRWDVKCTQQKTFLRISLTPADDRQGISKAEEICLGENCQSFGYTQAQTEVFSAAAGREFDCSASSLSSAMRGIQGPKRHNCFAVAQVFTLPAICDSLLKRVVFVGSGMSEERLHQHFFLLPLRSNLRGDCEDSMSKGGLATQCV